MDKVKYGQWLEKTIRWLLLIVIVIYIVTGYGITEFRTVEDLTFGLITKPLAFKIHDALSFPFMTLVVLHITLPSVLRHLKLK